MKRVYLFILLIFIALPLFAYTKVYESTGFKAESANTQAFPDEIYMASLCIQTECTGYLPCTLLKFDDEANCRSKLYDLQIIRAGAKQPSFLYHIFDNGTYIADYELQEGDRFLLTALDGSGNIYVESTGEIFRVKANEDDIRSREYDSGFVVYSATGDAFPDDIQSLNVCIRGNCSGPVESAMMQYSDRASLAQMGYEAYIIRRTGIESEGYWVEEPGLIITDEKFTDDLCVVFRSADQKHELYLSKAGMAINDSIPFKI